MRCKGRRESRQQVTADAGEMDCEKDKRLLTLHASNLLHTPDKGNKWPGGDSRPVDAVGVELARGIDDRRERVASTGTEVNEQRIDDDSLTLLLLTTTTTTTMADQSDAKFGYIANSQLEHLHSRYTGTIHPDTTRHEWITHQHRDTAASILGHPMLHSYIALADGVSKARTAAELKDKMLQPCGPPNKQED